MKTSQNGLAFIAREEGIVLHVYKDQVGIDTIGVGHRVLPGETFPATITHDQAMQLLAHDVDKVEDSINRHVTVELNQNQFDALASFAFNVGTGALEGSTLLKLVNQGNFASASSEFPKWCHAGGQVNPVIQARRRREQLLFLTPVAPSVPVVPDPPVVPVVPQAPIAPVQDVSPRVLPPAAPVGFIGFIKSLAGLFTGKK